MSRTAEVVLAFGGDERPFRLNIGRLRALQEKTDAGPQELMNRIIAQTWRVDEIRETLFQGLVGGGMSSADATRLMKSDFDELPFGQFVQHAHAVLLAAVIGVEEEDAGEPKGEPATPSMTSPRDASGSAASTEPAQS